MGKKSMRLKVSSLKDQQNWPIFFFADERDRPSGIVKISSRPISKDVHEELGSTRKRDSSPSVVRGT